jgi:anti-anti-sigma regulatory factor
MGTATERMKLVKKDCGVKVYKMFGTYTVDTTADYYQVCSPVVKDDDTKAILLDFAEVDDIDTAGFACIMNFIKENLKEGIKIGIINVNKREKDLTEILKIERAIQHFDTEEDAISGLKCD